MATRRKTTSHRHLLTIATAVLLLLAPAAWAARHALLIGIGDYSASGLHDLAGTHEDVRIMQQVLQGRFEIPPENIAVLLDEQATHRGIEQALSGLAERIALAISSISTIRATARSCAMPTPMNGAPARTRPG